MEGQADTPMPGGQPPGQPSAAPPPPPSRQAPLIAKALRAARGLPPGVDPEGDGSEVPPRVPGAPPGQSPAPHPLHATTGPGVPRDPLSVPFQLPSGGLYYPHYGHQDTIYISPTRGAQEEVLAGIQGGSGARLKVLMHVTKQCFQTGDIPFDALLLDDWVAALLHFLSYSAGSDVLALRPTHSACGSSFPATMKLADLPLRILRFAEPGEESNWPPDFADDDDDLSEEMRILREMEAEEAREAGAAEDPRANIEEYVLRSQDAQEPFRTSALPNGDVVTWRLVRLVDLVKAEEFAERIGSTQTQPGTKLHTFLLARHIELVNEDRMSPTRAYQWVKGQASPILNALREQINARTCGYDTAPRFRCRNCGGSFKVRLPLDGKLFRRPSRKRR